MGMTLEEAIKHCEKVTESHCDKCGDEHRQLAEWLRELQIYQKEKTSKCTKTNCPIQMEYISNDCDIKTCPYRTERKIGKWKNVALFTRECSECGAQIHELEYDNFCPNCGADMREEDIPIEYFESGGK